MSPIGHCRNWAVVLTKASQSFSLSVHLNKGRSLRKSIAQWQMIHTAHQKSMKCCTPEFCRIDSMNARLRRKRTARNISSDLWDTQLTSSLTDLTLTPISRQMLLNIDPFTLNKEFLWSRMDFKICFKLFHLSLFFILSFFPLHFSTML